MPDGSGILPLLYKLAGLPISPYGVLCKSKKIPYTKIGTPQKSAFYCCYMQVKFIAAGRFLTHFGRFNMANDGD